MTIAANGGRLRENPASHGTKKKRINNYYGTGSLLFAVEAQFAFAQILEFFSEARARIVRVNFELSAFIAPTEIFIIQIAGGPASLAVADLFDIAAIARAHGNVKRDE